VLQALTANSIPGALKSCLMKKLPSDPTSVVASVTRDILCR
jgi:hypothetical protein